MPIYEFFCAPCNCVYSFLCKNPAAPQTPVCPKCGSDKLKKMISRFAVCSKTAAPSAAGPETSGADIPTNPRAEGEMLRLMQEVENIDDNDSRQIGGLLRRFSELSGEPLDAGMEEAVSRLEAGEDPEKIEADLGEELAGDEGHAQTTGSRAAAARPASRDSGLYSM